MASINLIGLPHNWVMSITDYAKWLKMKKNIIYHSEEYDRLSPEETSALIKTYKDEKADEAKEAVAGWKTLWESYFITIASKIGVPEAEVDVYYEPERTHVYGMASPSTKRVMIFFGPEPSETEMKEVLKEELLHIKYPGKSEEEIQELIRMVNPEKEKKKPTLKELFKGEVLNGYLEAARVKQLTEFLKKKEK